MPCLKPCLTGHDSSWGGDEQLDAALGSHCEEQMCLLCPRCCGQSDAIKDYLTVSGRDVRLLPSPWPGSLPLMIFDHAIELHFTLLLLVMGDSATS